MSLVRENFTQGSVRGESGDRLSYRVGKLVMRKQKITQLIEILQRQYGDAYAPYGTDEFEEDGTGFTVDDIAATFSICCLEDTKEGFYDIQVESVPPGDYVYANEIPIGELLDFIERYRQPAELWP